jgi:adenylylsulfate kinase
MPYGDFNEIYCKASLAICEERDIKGLYKKAQAGEIKNYTGIDSPYEKPIKPELTLDTEQLSIEEAVKKVMELLVARGIVNDFS